MDNAPEVAIMPEYMTSVTEPAIEKDDVYYWSDNVRFLVQGKLFRVSRHQFILGSKYFSEKYHLGGGDDEGTTDTVQLDDITAAEFRVFLRIVFPSHTTSTTTSFTKVEWLTILELSVRWHFHDFRKLAIEHLDGSLTGIERIKIGRAAYVPRWVLCGYQSLVMRKADDIGNRTVNTLWIVRYFLTGRKLLDVWDELAWRLSDEVSMLEAEESQRRTVADIKLEAKRAEEERRLEEERRVKAVAEQAERERLEEERARSEEELEAARLLEEESRRGLSVLITHRETEKADRQELSSLQHPETLEVDIPGVSPDVVDILLRKSTAAERKALRKEKMRLARLKKEQEELEASKDEWEAKRAQEERSLEEAAHEANLAAEAEQARLAEEERIAAELRLLEEEECMAAELRLLEEEERMAEEAEQRRVVEEELRLAEAVPPAFGGRGNRGVTRGLGGERGGTRGFGGRGATGGFGGGRGGFGG
ncbi:hypothetical protein DFP72DRAFT_880087 [Ephemerocybe angulata]|uniref:BTB domain-containing protein n=1 Tax=Ephemerocybe angulata TaxID=980116 RepID=A0A8H6IC40_9AGAR|nr:hypothetical protein DFP72DRAFT_880087 [Tulosesus angulatus]